MRLKVIVVDFCHVMITQMTRFTTMQEEGMFIPGFKVMPPAQKHDYVNCNPLVEPLLKKQSLYLRIRLLRAVRVDSDGWLSAQAENRVAQIKQQNLIGSEGSMGRSMGVEGGRERKGTREREFERKSSGEEGGMEEDVDKLLSSGCGGEGRDGASYGYER
eukprot:353059-Amorphochlora_amoeboformis.AAC.1